jgi:hypothetical protein
MENTVKPRNLATLIWAAILIALPLDSAAKAGKRKAPHPTTDMVTQTFKQNCVPVNITSAALDDPETFVFRPEFPWGSTGLEVLFPDPAPQKKGEKKAPEDKYVPQTDTAYVVHVTVWKKNPDKGKDADIFVLATSNWYAYRASRVKEDGKKTVGLRQSYSSTGTGDLPLVYGAKSVELISIQRVADEDDSAKQLQVTYTITPSQGTPENVANVGRVFSAFFGLQSGSGKGSAMFAREEGKNACAERFSIQGTSILPYDLSIKFTYVSPKSKGQGSAAKVEDKLPAIESGHEKPSGGGPHDNIVDDDKGVVAEEAVTAKSAEGPVQAGGAPPPAAAKDDAASGTGISRTIHVLDKEWWDLSLSLSIPGVREPKVSLNKDNVVTPSVTRHVDVYGFINLYPFAAKKPKNSFAPHFNVGLPFSGQPLHRWFAGASEKIPWIEKAVGIPVNVFAGTVFLKESISTLPGGTKASDTATFTNSLHDHWVRKGMFGLEFPVSALVGKIGKK